MTSPRAADIASCKAKLQQETRPEWDIDRRNLNMVVVAAHHVEHQLGIHTAPQIQGLMPSELSASQEEEAAKE